MEIELEPIPLPIICSDDVDSHAIRRYLEDTEKVTRLHCQYVHGLTDDDDDVVFLVGKYKKPYQKSGINIFRELLKNIKHEGDNFRKVYIEIAFIAHVLLAINREQRGIYKTIPKVVRQAIELYESISPENFGIYIAYKNIVWEKRGQSVTFHSFIVMSAIVAAIFIATIIMLSVWLVNKGD